MVGRRPHPTRALLCALALLATSACATIMNGSNQPVMIGSTPNGARILVNGIGHGTTPMSANLSRNTAHVIRIEADGYQPYELQLTRGVSGWVAGNIIFGGIPGLVVDLVTGSLYNLSPAQLQAHLHESRASVRVERNTLYVAAVLEPDPSWIRIGSLERASTRSTLGQGNHR
jgi:hypothetical protein